MTDTRQDMVKAIKDAVFNLARIRGAHPSDALRDALQTYRENLELSVGTTMENYWKLMVDVADREVRAEFV